MVEVVVGIVTVVDMAKVTHRVREAMAVAVTIVMVQVLEGGVDTRVTELRAMAPLDMEVEVDTRRG